MRTMDRPPSAHIANEDRNVPHFPIYAAFLVWTATVLDRYVRDVEGLGCQNINFALLAEFTRPAPRDFIRPKRGLWVHKIELRIASNNLPLQPFFVSWTSVKDDDVKGI